MFNLPAGRFYLLRVIPSGHTIWAGFSFSYPSRKTLGKDHLRVLQQHQEENFAAPRAGTSCRGEGNSGSGPGQAESQGRALLNLAWGSRRDKEPFPPCSASPRPARVLSPATVQAWRLYIVPSALLPQMSFAFRVPGSYMLCETSLLKGGVLPLRCGYLPAWGQLWFTRSSEQ